MGLDITSYSGVFRKKTLLLEKIEAYHELENHEIYLYDNGHFLEHQDGFSEGVYSFRGECISFGAGSYSSYGEWRRRLRNIVCGKMSDEYFFDNFNEYKNFAFIELIYFSDCEGFIGPKTSRKLYNDFVEHEQKFNRESSRFLDRYKDWKEAFKLASNNGIVDFH